MRPGFRERVEALTRARWREPVIAVRLADTALGYEVPGRRPDGTVEGSDPVGRAFTLVGRGIGAAVLNVVGLANGAFVGNPFQRQVRVKGPAGALALDLVDRLRSTGAAWLAFSPSAVAVVDTGSTAVDPAEAPAPVLVWEGRGLRVGFRRRTITWPDGSTFEFPLHGPTEEKYLRSHLGPDTVRWPG